MPRAYVRRRVRATKPIFRRVYRSPVPAIRAFAHTKTAAASAERRRFVAAVI